MLFPKDWWGLVDKSLNCGFFLGGNCWKDLFRQGFFGPKIVGPLMPRRVVAQT